MPRRSAVLDKPTQESATHNPTILTHPHVAFGRDVCGDLSAGLRREWLVTNGLGGYASGTLSGIATRSYHGLLVAALEPPVARTVLVGGLVEWATYDGNRYPLSTYEFAGGTVTPDGYRHLADFRLEGTLPVWTFALADALLERRHWMPHGANTTFITYRLARASLPVELDLTPLVTYGLRTLPPDHPGYRGDYGGDQYHRDSSYHMGPVWPWLIGAYVEAHHRLHGDADASLDLLRPFAHHLRDAGLGSISEILEGDPPHMSRGCIAQAWSVAEVLRVWRMLDGEQDG
jgi:glycogen debranching enzyme